MVIVIKAETSNFSNPGVKQSIPCGDPARRKAGK